MTSEQIAWLAGLLEGEGYFCLQTKRLKSPTKPRGVYPKIVFVSTDKDICDRVSALFGTSPNYVGPRKDHYKPVWRALKVGTGASEILRLILPYMGQRRREKIEDILYRAKLFSLVK